MKAKVQLRSEAVQCAISIMDRYLQTDTFLTDSDTLYLAIIEVFEISGSGSGPLVQFLESWQSQLLVDFD